MLALPDVAVLFSEVIAATQITEYWWEVGIWLGAQHGGEGRQGPTAGGQPAPPRRRAGPGQAPLVQARSAGTPPPNWRPRRRPGVAVPPPSWMRREAAVALNGSPESPESSLVVAPFSPSLIMVKY
jgi:hypothetical protein